MLNKFAPIALFVYKRPEHTARTIEHLIRNPEFDQSAFHVFCDGPKNANDLHAVEETRRVVRTYNLPNLYMHEQTINLGLANSIIRGATQLCREFERVIVLEDDLLVAHGFLDYMNRALDKFAQDEIVMQICGHTYPFQKDPGTDDAFFLPLTNTIGWATWQRAWNMLDLSCTGHEALKSDQLLRKRFDLDGTYPYSRMMFSCMSGRMDVWAIKWWWSVFQHNGLCLYPRNSLVLHEGFGAAATNTKGADTYINDPEWLSDRTVGCLPDKVEPSHENYELLKKYIVSRYGSLTAKTKRQLTKFRSILTDRLHRALKTDI